MAASTIRPTIRIEKLPDDAAVTAARTVELPMVAADRRRVRRRVTAPDGTVFELALPTGTALPVGAALHVEDDVAYRIAAAPERVIEVRPRSLREAAFVGHLIGNLHRDVDLRDDAVLALWDAPLEKRLRDAGLVCDVADRPFRGRAPGEHAH